MQTRGTNRRHLTRRTRSVVPLEPGLFGKQAGIQYRAELSQCNLTSIISHRERSIPRRGTIQKTRRQTTNSRQNETSKSIHDDATLINFLVFIFSPHSFYSIPSYRGPSLVRCLTNCPSFSSGRHQPHPAATKYQDNRSENIPAHRGFRSRIRLTTSFVSRDI